MKLRLRNVLAASVIVVLMAGIVMTLILIRNGVNPFSEATTTDAPQNIVIANQWTGRIGIAFETAGPTTAYILLGSDPAKLTTTLNDEVTGPSTLHLFNATLLQPGQTYYYKFSVNGTNFDNNGQPYSVKVLQLNTTPFEQLPISGKTDPARKVCLVYSHLVSGSSTSLPSIDTVAVNGTYTVNLDYLLTRDTFTAFPRTDASLLTYALCDDGMRGGVVYKPDAASPTITLSSTFPVEHYSNDLTQFEGVTPVVTTPVVTSPTPSISQSPVVTSPRVTTPAVTASPSATVKVTTPVPGLPRTGIIDDGLMIIKGMLLVSAGVFFFVRTRRSSSSAYQY